jgi:hypothetical protein
LWPSRAVKIKINITDQDGQKGHPYISFIRLVSEAFKIIGEGRSIEIYALRAILNSFLAVFGVPLTNQNGLNVGEYFRGTRFNS